MNTMSSGQITKFDRGLFRFVAFFDGEGEGEDDGTDDEGEGETGSEGSSGTKQEVVNDPEKKKLSDEAARYRVQARDEKAQREALELRVKEFEDKDKSETEKLQSTSQALEKSNAELKGRNVELVVQNAALKSASKFDFIDVDDAMKLAVEGSEIQGDEDNLEALITEALTKLVKDKPYLLKAKSEDESESESLSESGRATNGKKKSKSALDEEALLLKFPALRR